MEERFAFRKAIKKIAAAVAGAGMVGATLMGAAAAVDLGSFPDPFVLNNHINTILVLGEKAKPIDVIAGTEILTALQRETVDPVDLSTGVPRGGSSFSLTGDYVEFGRPGDLLELGEYIGDVRETITEFELDALKGGVITTDKGSTEYNQYLRFEHSAPELIKSGRVLFTENDEPREKVGDFLYFQESNLLNQSMFEYELEFEEGLEGDIVYDSGCAGVTSTSITCQTGSIEDYEDEVLNILGVDYTIVDSAVNVKDNVVTLELLGGDVVDTMEEGERKVYEIDGVQYEVEVLIISDARQEAKFLVNGEATDELSDGETDVLADGMEIGVRHVMENEAEEVTGGDIVEFFLGANKIEFTDTNIGDCNAATTPFGFYQGVEITNEDIEEGYVQICGQVLSSNETLKVSSITYRLLADARSGESNIYIPAGHGLREYLDEPEGMLNPAWDVFYGGLVDTGVSTVVIDASGEESYNLKFTNRQGNDYEVPFVDNSLTFKLGEDADSNARNGLVFSEAPLYINWETGAANKTYFIKDDDYFVLANHDTKYDKNAYSHVLRYESVDVSNGELSFEDLATGTQEIIYTAVSGISVAGMAENGLLGRASLVIGGNTYNVFVSNDTTGDLDAEKGTLYSIAVDLNGDGDVGNANTTSSNVDFDANNSLECNILERAMIVIDGGGIIDLGGINSSRLEVLARADDELAQTNGNTLPVQNCKNLSGGTAGVILYQNYTRINDTFTIALHTESSEFDENDGSETIAIILENEPGNEVGLKVVEEAYRINSSGVYNDSQKGYDFVLNEPDENEDFNLGMTQYGILFSVFDSDSGDSPEELTIEYPLVQRGVHVFVTVGDIGSRRLGSSEAVIINPINVGVTLLDSEVRDYFAQNMIVVGGPCVNDAAAALLGNPEDCTAGFEEGKAKVKLFQNGENVAMLVAGYSGADTRVAGQVVAEFRDYNLAGMEVEVNTQTQTVTTVGFA